MSSWLSRLLASVLPTPPAIDPGEDAVFVDVRTAGEYAAGHVAGAHHIPHDQIGQRWKELRHHRKQRLLVYCRSGRRSALAARVLRANGFARAENAGGLGGLKRAGLEIARGR